MIYDDERDHYDGERDHYKEMAKEAVSLIKSDDDLRRMTDAIRAISRQRMMMRHEMFPGAMTAAELEAFVDANRRDGGSA